MANKTSLALNVAEAQVLLPVWQIDVLYAAVHSNIPDLKQAADIRSHDLGRPLYELHPLQ